MQQMFNGIIIVWSSRYRLRLAGRRIRPSETAGSIGGGEVSCISSCVLRLADLVETGPKEDVLHRERGICLLSSLVFPPLAGRFP